MELDDLIVLKRRANQGFSEKMLEVWVGLTKFSELHEIEKNSIDIDLGKEIWKPKYGPKTDYIPIGSNDSFGRLPYPNLGLGAGEIIGVYDSKNVEHLNNILRVTYSLGKCYDTKLVVNS